ncbi:MAG TPA: enolase C-terminal domain-like protein [Gaiellaceae bacterium]|jgi:L-alanine-DL-glutamate epimerase-like enolase superfamily enzyme
MSERAATVAAVETTTVTLRAKPALAVRSSRTTHAGSSFVLVRVLTSDGVAGYGEVSATAAWSGEDAVTATHFVRELLGPLLVGRPLAPVAAHTAAMDRVLRGNPFTKAGVNTALWDALGRTVDLPVATLLGGPFRDEVPIKISLSGDGDDLRAGYETATSLGFRAFKVKVGRDPRTDAARVALARELAGPDAYLGVDANGGWTRADAARALRRMAPADIAFAEQPVQPSDLEGMRDLRSLGVPVVADEAVYAEADVLRVAEIGAADTISVYVGKSSGLERAVRSAALAAAHGLDVVIGSNGEMGIGAAAQAHVACACERLGPTPCGIIGHHFYEDGQTLETPLDIDGRRARLPEGAGLGVEPAEEIRRTFAS